MRELIKEVVDFDDSDVHEIQFDLFLVGPATFVRDFGPFKRGQRVDSVAFNFETGTLESNAIDGELLHSVEFTLEPR